MATTKFLTELDEDLKCVICLEVARDPLQHEACGRLICKQCLEQYGRDQPCPNCGNLQSHYFVDNRGKRAIDGLKVKCTNADLMKCEWEGSLSALKDHLAVCLKAPTFCNQAMLRCEVEEHDKSECELAVISCRYSEVGCKVTLRRKDLAAHEEDSKQVHLDMAMDKLREINANSDAVTAEVVEDGSQENLKLLKSNNRSEPFLLKRSRDEKSWNFKAAMIITFIIFIVLAAMIAGTVLGLVLA